MRRRRTVNAPHPEPPKPPRHLPTVRELDGAALDLLRSTRDADPNCPHCLDQLAQGVRRLNAVFGVEDKTLRPVQGRGQELIDDCRALAIHLRATAWNTIGLQAIFNDDSHRHTLPARLDVSALERSCAERVLASYQGTTAFFETAVWYPLQLEPIDRIVLGSLVTHLGKSVAVTNADTLDNLWQSINNNLTTGPPPAGGPDPRQPGI